jgi:hypothetical protein
MTSRTYYDTLQVSRFASASVIRAAYKALSQKHHPDKNPSNLETAHQNMKRLNEAYEVLRPTIVSRVGPALCEADRRVVSRARIDRTRTARKVRRRWSAVDRSGVIAGTREAP